MSSPLALATVTAVLQNFIQNSITDHDLAATLGGSITVSAEPLTESTTARLRPTESIFFFFKRLRTRAGEMLVFLPVIPMVIELATHR